LSGRDADKAVFTAIGGGTLVDTELTQNNIAYHTAASIVYTFGLYCLGDVDVVRGQLDENLGGHIYNVS
jgi:hypothetical protein